MADSRVEELRIVARIVVDQLHLSPGGDAYEYLGSTNDVDELREILDDLDFEPPDPARED